MNAFYIFLGGGLGSLARWGTGIGLQKFGGITLVVAGTLVSNFISCILLGYFFSTWQDDKMDMSKKLFFMTGFCGGYSTFSTLSLELVQFMRQGEWITATAYTLGSLLLGLLGIGIGMKLSSL